MAPSFRRAAFIPSNNPLMKELVQEIEAMKRDTVQKEEKT